MRGLQARRRQPGRPTHHHTSSHHAHPAPAHTMLRSLIGVALHSAAVSNAVATNGMATAAEDLVPLRALAVAALSEEPADCVPSAADESGCQCALTWWNLALDMDPGADPCADSGWGGVTCSDSDDGSSQRVTGLSLPNCGFTSVPEHIFHLSQLLTLDLSGNAIQQLPDTMYVQPYAPSELVEI